MKNFIFKLTPLIFFGSAIPVYAASNVGTNETLAKIPSNAKITYVGGKTRSANGKIEMTTYAEDTYYEFSYPKVCEVKWYIAQDSSSSSQVSYRCPNTYGFSKFEWWYGSGVKSFLSGDNVIMDDQHGIYPADNEWHTFSVLRAPHNGQASWTKVRMIPLF